VQLVECGLLSDVQAKNLVDAYKDYRTCSHQRALQQQSSLLEARIFETQRNEVKKIWQHIFEKT
jgi:glutamine synthetase adenylyltransferase